MRQRCRRLGRYVIAMGVAGSTAKSLAAACDEFEAYDNLPGVERPEAPTRTRTRRGQSSGSGGAGPAATSSGSAGSAGSAGI